MPVISQTPFARVLVPVILGILCARYNEFPLYLCLIILVSLAVLLALFRWLPSNFKYRILWLNAILLNAFLLLFGTSLYEVQQRDQNSSWYKNGSESSHYLLEIESPLEEKKKSYKALASIRKKITKKETQTCQGKVYLYFSKSEKSKTVKEGDKIVTLNNLNEIKDAGNPGEFKYSQFVQNKGIHDRAFLKDSEWQIISHSKSVGQKFNRLSLRIRAILTTYIPDEKSAGIAQALLIGYKSEIDAETYEAYIKSGLVHLIAISGLHMGIFYFGLLKLLQFIPILRRKKKVRILLSLGGMWIFAALTAFPPSVLRASIMFTLLALGQVQNRASNSLNYLLASAFILLCFNANYLFEPGFQLSYAAVLGILFYFKPIHEKLSSRWKLLNSVTKIFSLSIAAQIFTLPISIYYFHNIPLLFFLTNIVAIPLVSLSIYGELLLLFVSNFPLLAKPMGICVSKILGLLNQFIEECAQLKFVSISDVSISLSQCLLIILIMILLGLYLIRRMKIAVPILLACVVIFMSTLCHSRWQHLNQERLIIYNHNKESIIQIIKGQESFMMDSISLKNKEDIEKYILRPSAILHQSKARKEAFEYKSSNKYIDLINIGKLRLARIKKSYKLRSSAAIKVDYLIISDKYVKDFDLLLKQFEFKELIIDGTVPLWKIEALEKELSELDLPVHIMGIDGAKIIPL